MKWYNPLTWFKKKSVDGSFHQNIKVADDDIKLFCANPQCSQKEIFRENEPIAYDLFRKEFYHNSDCAMLGNAHRAMNLGEITHMNLQHIKYDKAISLLGKGKIKNSSKLEEKIKNR